MTDVRLAHHGGAWSPRHLLELARLNKEIAQRSTAPPLRVVPLTMRLDPNEPHAERGDYR